MTFQLGLSESDSEDARPGLTKEFLDRLRDIASPARVLTDPALTAPFRTGFRFGTGAALAVVRPRSLVELWRVLEACVAADKIVIMQAANTGLTGGSTPNGEDYDRDVVIINPMGIAKVHLIEEGRQVVCLPGSTLYQLEAALKPLGREPHSVIGSSCIGASVLGGICNNSGGALIRRGPAFTELALYAQRGADGALRLVNHLGIELGNEPEAMLERLERGEFLDVAAPEGRRASDQDYQHRVRKVDSDSPARFNADPTCLREASGSAGRLAVFAVRLDTFPAEAESRVFYIGSNDPAELTEIRRHILARFDSLPIAGEYMHRDCFDIAELYGKDSFLAIHHLGTARMPMLFAWKARFDRLLARIGLGRPGASDRLMQRLSRLFPSHLPARMKAFRDRYEHHLLLRMGGSGIAEAEAHLRSIFPSTSGDYFECSDDEGAKAFLHRFAAAGAAIRYRTIHAETVEDIIALDIALRRNDREWVEKLPPEIESKLIHKLYYGHFFCHVFHQDYVVRKGCEPMALEHEMLALLDARGAEYPAEHNVGHLYPAKPALEQFYRELDPCNSFNPGIGKTSKRANWA
jgi:D-lactate dehydrogenase